MIYDPVGKLLGKVKFFSDNTGPNQTSPTTPQPDGTKFLSEGEGYDVRAWNRALMGAAQGFDRLAMWGIGGPKFPYVPECRYEVTGGGVVDGATLSEMLVNGWVNVNVSPTLARRDAIVYMERPTPSGIAYEQLFSDLGEPIVVSDWQDGLGSTVTGNSPTLQVAAEQIQDAGLGHIEVTSDLEVFPQSAIPGLLCLIDGSTDDVHDGWYKITQVEHTKVDLINFRHRLRLTGMAGGSWSVGNSIAGSTSGTTGIIRDSDLTEGWIEVDVLSDDSDTFLDDLDVTDGISDTTVPDDATLDVYDQPGEPPLFDTDALTAIGCTAAVYTTPHLYYAPTAILDPPYVNTSGAPQQIRIAYPQPSQFGAFTPPDWDMRDAQFMRDAAAVWRQDMLHEDRAAIPAMHFGGGWAVSSGWNVPPRPKTASYPDLTYVGIRADATADNYANLVVTQATNTVEFQFDPLTGWLFEMDDITGFSPGDSAEINEMPADSKIGEGIIYDVWTLPGPLVDRYFVRFIPDYDAAPSFATAPQDGDKIIVGANERLITSPGGTPMAGMFEQEPGWSLFTEGRWCRGWYAAETDPKAKVTCTNVRLTPGTYAVYVKAKYVNDFTGTTPGQFNLGPGYYAELNWIQIDGMTREEFQDFVAVYLVLVTFVVDVSNDVSTLDWSDLVNRAWPTGQTSITAYQAALADGQSLIAGSQGNQPTRLLVGLSNSIDRIHGLSPSYKRFVPRVGLATQRELVDTGPILNEWSPWGMAASTNERSSGLSDGTLDSDYLLWASIPNGGDLISLLIIETSPTWSAGDSIDNSGSGGTATGTVESVEARPFVGVAECKALIVSRAAGVGEFQVGDVVDDGTTAEGIVIDVQRASVFWTGMGGGGNSEADLGDAGYVYPAGAKMGGYGYHNWGLLRLELERGFGSESGGLFEIGEEVADNLGAPTKRCRVIHVGAGYIDVVQFEGAAFTNGDNLQGAASGASYQVDGVATDISVRSDHTYCEEAENDIRLHHVPLASVLFTGGKQDEEPMAIGGKSSFEAGDVQLHGPKIIRKYLTIGQIPPVNSTGAYTDVIIPVRDSPGLTDPTGANWPMPNTVQGRVSINVPTDESPMFGIDLPEAVTLVDAGVNIQVDTGTAPRLDGFELLMMLHGFRSATSARFVSVVGHAFRDDHFIPNPTLAMQIPSSETMVWSRENAGVAGSPTSGHAACWACDLDSALTANHNVGRRIASAGNWEGRILEYIPGATNRIRFRVTSLSVDPPGNPPETATAVQIYDQNNATPISRTLSNVKYPFGPYQTGAPVATPDCGGFLIGRYHTLYLIPRAIQESGTGTATVWINSIWIDYAVHDLRC